MINPSHILTFSFGAGVTILIMLGLGYQLDGDMGLCKLEAANSAAETPATCLRSWLGALSGWVAVVGALGIGLPTLNWMRAQTQLPTVKAEIIELEKLIQSLRDADSPIGDLYGLMDTGKCNWSDVVTLAKKIDSSLNVIEKAFVKIQTLGLEGIEPDITSAISIASDLAMTYGFMILHHGDREVSEEIWQAAIVEKFEKIRKCLVQHRDGYIPILTNELARLRKWQYRQAIPH
ncbi:MAG: hypothetical protein OIF58_11175 [Cohaesibacter sp.]|nr:hypothetical protein [Cohaesibacter sp.]